MKKILSLFGLFLFIGSMIITSCSSSSSICPAYPPSVYHGDANIQNADNDVEVINKDKSL